MENAKALLRRARRIKQTEGPWSLLRLAAAYLLSHLFYYQTYYLSVARTDDPAEQNEADFMPRVDDFTVRIVSTNEQADELEAQGFEFRSCALNSRERLSKGAIASCVFVGRELGHVGWAAVTQEAMSTLHELPIRIDFSKNEGYRGATWTDPRYRRMRLGLHGMLVGRRLLRERGVEVVRTAMTKKNAATQSMMVKFKQTFYAEGRYVRLLWWESWKEKPLNLQGQEAVRQSNEPNG